MSATTPACHCGRPAANGVYRQCPEQGCRVEIAHCEMHDGDAASVEAMRGHLEDVHGRPGPKAEASAFNAEILHSVNLTRRACGMVPL